MRTKPEGQTFDHESVKIDVRALAAMLVTMANADGNDIDIEAVATLGIIRHEGPIKAGKWIILKQS